MIQLKIVFLFVVDEQGPIFPEITVILKDILTVIPSRQYMIDMLLGSYSCCPRHALKNTFDYSLVN
jgi:hypothetical protein